MTRVRQAATIGMTVFVLLSGCLQGPADKGNADAEKSRVEGSVVPWAPIVPTASVDPGPYRMVRGEPLLATAGDYAVLSFLACDDHTYESLVAAASLGLTPCGHGRVWFSSDQGTTWMSLNDDEGMLHEGLPPGASDIAATVAPDGVVSILNMASDTEMQFAQWTEGTMVAESGHNQDERADRPWIVHASDGSLVETWFGFNDEYSSVTARHSTDQGSTWSQATRLGQDVHWLGSLQVLPDGRIAQPLLLDGPFGTPAGQGSELVLAQTLDHGRNWMIEPTGIEITASGMHAQFTGALFIPSVAGSPDGTTMLSWAEYDSEASPLGPIPVVKFSWRSPDGVWSPPITLGLDGAAIMPSATWSPAGWAIAYYQSRVPVIPDAIGTWDVGVSHLQNKTWIHEIVDEAVHVGGACGRGGSCQAGGDRTLLDFLSLTTGKDGRLLLAYAVHDPVGQESRIQVAAAQR